MKDYLVKVPTHRWKIASLMFCIIVFVWLAATEYVPINRTPPGIMILFCAIALLTGWKTIYLRLNEMQVCYNLVLFKRSIALEHIHSLEIVLKNQECFLLIALDNCPSFKSEKTNSVELYILKHPIKVIAVQCSKEDALNCKPYFDASHIHTDIIIKNRRKPEDSLRGP